MKTPILEMKHIRKTFASTVALGDVDLNVYPGEIRGLIGENGSGKSTISSIAAGMQKADCRRPIPARCSITARPGRPAA